MVMKPELNADGYSVRGCQMIYAPAGQAGEYSKLATNPFRGCGHSCVYCLDGDTRIQMADGRTVSLRDVSVGEKIIGVEQLPGRQLWPYQYVEGFVTAKMRTWKPALRITTENTSVISSADHRWLSDRGWKYTQGECSQRPFLTTKNTIRALGPCLIPLSQSGHYMRGYLSGVIRGDGHLKRYDYSGRYQRSNKKSPQKTDILHQFRLALTDQQAIDRTTSFLEHFGVVVDAFPFANEGQPMSAIRASSRSAFETITDLIKALPTKEWLRGWLAGIFDAEGSDSTRISNTDEEILTITERAEAIFGFDHVRDVPSQSGAVCVRFRGGLSEMTRFFQLTQPAITRKWGIVGSAPCARSKVEAIEDLGEVREMFDISTTCETFIANGLISHNCYVPDVLNMSREEFDAGAVPRPNYLRELQKDARKYQALNVREQVMLSFTTDPYNPDDEKRAFTRAAIEILVAHGLDFCTLTKGGYRALRDIDMFRPERDSFATTLTSLDDRLSLRWEPRAALPAERIHTLAEFHNRGVYTWVSLEPVYDPAATLQVIRETHKIVDLYKVGRMNHNTLTKRIDWRDFTERVIELLAEVGNDHYIKKDLQPFLPAGYQNNRYRPQRRELPVLN